MLFFIKNLNEVNKKMEKTKKNEKNNISEIFGLSEEEINNLQNFLPILNISKLEPNSFCIVKFLEEKPTEVETPNSKYSKISKIIKCADLTFDELDPIECSLFLSAKSLNNGLAKLYLENNNSLLNVKAKITVKLINYKNFGENRGYEVERVE